MHKKNVTVGDTNETTGKKGFTLPLKKNTEMVKI